MAERLERARRDRPVRFLHDRRVPGSRVNVDHLPVTPSGVWVIDAKRYVGRLRIESRGGLLRSPVQTLRVDGRDRTKLVDGVERQVAVVREALGAPATDVGVHGVMCFVKAELPLLVRLQVRDVLIDGPRRLGRRLAQPGPLEEGRIESERGSAPRDESSRAPCRVAEPAWSRC